MVNDKQSGTPAPNISGQNEPQDLRDYLRGHAAKWLVENVNRARRSARFENALTAITRCIAPEVECGMDLAGTLAAFACIEVSKKHGGGKKSLEGLWALGTGKTWKALCEFPERLRRIAKEMAQINESACLAPALYANAKTIQAQIIRKRLEQLPATVNFYATALEMHTARIPKQWAKMIQAQFPDRPRGPSWSVPVFSHIVRVATGKWHDKEIAELLNAGALALDVKGWNGVDALNIAQARSRWKKANPLSLKRTS
jgi:hypothetical protein